MRWLAAIVWLLAGSVLGTPAAIEAGDMVSAGRLDEAEALISAELDAGSPSNELLYQLARLKSLQGDLRTGSAALTAAVAAGFTDFFRLEHDAALLPLRHAPAYRAIAENRTTLLEDRAGADFEAARRAFPARYVFERVPELRLQFVSAHPEDVLREVIAEAERVRDWLEETCWNAPVDPQLDPWVTVILPTPEDFVRLVGGAAGTVGGFYDPEVRRLVSQDLGPSLRHELVHVFHFRHLERLRQSRPLWLTEGLATLVESLDPLEAGIAPVGCWRTDIARRRLGAGRLLGWSDLFEQDRERFVGHRPKAQYAEARAIAMFLHHEGLLRAVCDAFARTAGDDPSGIAAIELAAGEPADRVERRFRGWLAALKTHEPDAIEGTTRLGLILREGRGDGPVVEHVELRSAASAARLRMRDVIRAVDGRPVRTVAEFLRAVEARETSEVTVLRGRAFRTLTLGPAAG